MDGFYWNLSATEQWLGLLGSSLVLIAYAITVARPEKRGVYCAISLAGGVVLLVVAVIYRNLGLILLEIAWISINSWGLWKVLWGPSLSASSTSK